MGVALITGASTGIGEGFARCLAREGYDLVLVARRAELLELAKALRRETGRAVRVLSADLTRQEDLRSVEDVLRSEPVDILVNNAGVAMAGRFQESELARETGMLCLNVEVTLRLVHAALPGMVARGRGALINVASCMAWAPWAYLSTYTGTKAFIESFSLALAEELRGSGVRVQALCPGITRTGAHQRAGLDLSRVPDFLWTTPDTVVAASLRGLKRGTVLCTTPLWCRMVRPWAVAAPVVTTRFVGWLSRRTFHDAASPRRPWTNIAEITEWTKTKSWRPARSSS